VARVGQLAEIDEADVALEGVEDRARDRDGDRGLAHPARPGDGDEAVPRTSAVMSAILPSRTTIRASRDGSWSLGLGGAAGRAAAGARAAERDTWVTRQQPRPGTLVT
jgi:hypothetical protein